MPNVIFYHNGSDNRALDKHLTQIASYDCKFKDNCSIMKPSLLISSNTNLFNANYCYIEDFHRYYYIVNIEVAQQMLYIDCKEDVLYTNKADILEMSGYVKRTSMKSQANLYLNDKLFTMQNNYFPSIKIFAENGKDKFEEETAGGWILAVSGPQAASPFPPEGGE